MRAPEGRPGTPRIVYVYLAIIVVTWAGNWPLMKLALSDAPPLVFAIVRSGPVEVYLNAPGPAVEEYPALKDRPIGGTLTLFIRITGIRAAYDALQARVNVVMPLVKKWYGVTEFACTDPDGYVITFAEQES